MFAIEPLHAKHHTFHRRHTYLPIPQTNKRLSMDGTKMPRTNRKAGLKTVQNAIGYDSVNLLVQRAIGKVLTKARARDRSRKHHKENRESKLRYSRDKYKAEKDDRAVYNKRRHELHRHEDNERMSRYQKEHRKEINAHRAHRRATDDAYSIECNARARLKHFLKANGVKKDESTFSLIGCTPSFLKEHLKKQLDGRDFRKCDIDHIFPFNAFDMTMPGNLRKVMHYSNLQPLLSNENSNKRCRLPTQQMASKVNFECWPENLQHQQLPEKYDGWRSALMM